MPTPSNTLKWKCSYARRTAAERFSRASDRAATSITTMRGLLSMLAEASLAMAVVLATAIFHIKAGQPNDMRSLIRPIPLSEMG